MTTADPSRSPAGTESAWAYTHLPRERNDDASADRLAESVDRVVEEQTPIRNVFLGSVSAHPGGSVHGVCGHNAAHAALKSVGIRGLPRRRLNQKVVSLLVRKHPSAGVVAIASVSRSRRFLL